MTSTSWDLTVPRAVCAGVAERVGTADAGAAARRARVCLAGGGRFRGMSSWSSEEEGHAEDDEVRPAEAVGAALDAEAVAGEGAADVREGARRRRGAGTARGSARTGPPSPR
jgi:hypothetical protein